MGGMHRRLSIVALALVSACSSEEAGPGASPDGSPPPSVDGGTSNDGGGDGPAGGSGIAARYPKDVGIEQDPDVVWVENFEEGSVQALTARYEDAKAGGITLVPDVPPNSAGSASGRFRADPASASQAADLFKRLDPGFDELYVRYYAKYQSGIQWHHTGVWIGGYNPAQSYPSPQAGNKPDGDDRFSVSFEPVGADGSPNPRMDFYDYWMNMRSYADPPMQGAYYGNTILQDPNVRVADDTWMCIEIHVKLNTDPASSAGAVRDLWIDGKLVAHFDDAQPLGCWVRDKFCRETMLSTPQCDYPNLCATPYVPLDLRMRSTLDLKLNAFWPQAYVTSGPAGAVQYDDMVVAKSYVGPLQP